MECGHLIVESGGAHAERVRIYTSGKPPALPTPSGGGRAPRPCHVVFFNDLSAARMHAHELLRRKLIDVDAGLYRATPMEAVAAIESIDLAHRRIYLDPDIAADRALSERVARLRSSRLRAELTWRLIGFGALILLVIKVLFGV
jgi:hypothetical protein